MIWARTAACSACTQWVQSGAKTPLLLVPGPGPLAPLAEGLAGQLTQRQARQRQWSGRHHALCQGDGAHGIGLPLHNPPLSLMAMTMHAATSALGLSPSKHNASGAASCCFQPHASRHKNWRQALTRSTCDLCQVAPCKRRSRLLSNIASSVLLALLGAGPQGQPCQRWTAVLLQLCTPRLHSYLVNFLGWA